jgi:hypothetical protein
MTLFPVLKSGKWKEDSGNICEWLYKFYLIMINSGRNIS